MGLTCCGRHWRGVSRRLCWTYMRTGDVMHAELACANEPGRREGAPRGHAAVLLCNRMCSRMTSWCDCTEGCQGCSTEGCQGPLASFSAAWKAAKAAFEATQKTQPSWVNKNSERRWVTTCPSSNVLQCRSPNSGFSYNSFIRCQN